MLLNFIAIVITANTSAEVLKDYGTHLYLIVISELHEIFKAINSSFPFKLFL